MKLTVLRSDLLKLLSKLQPVANSRHLLPILSHFLIETDKNGKEVKATASDLEVFLSGGCKAQIVEEGSVLLPLSVMDFLKVIKAEQVTVQGIHTDRLVKIEANEATHTLPSENFEDFPPVPVAGGKKVEIINLADSLKQVSYAMSTEDTRPVLASVCFTSKKGSVELAAADGFRLAVTNASAKGELAEQVLIPLRAVRLIEKLCPGKVTMQVSPKPESPNSQWATFESNGLVLTALVTQGTYPNYAQLIPNKGQYLTVATKDIKEAVLLASIPAKKGAGIISLLTEKKGLLVSGSNGDEVTETLVPVESGQVKIAFNYKYLMDIINRVGEKFTIRTTTPDAPAVVESNEISHIIMPMSAQWR